MGRPSAYKPEYNSQAEKLTKLGATDKQVADFFGVSEQTLNAWKKERPDFLESLKAGKQEVDSIVEKSLFQRACGFTVLEEKVVFSDGEPIAMKLEKQYPPDTVACIFWLKNRRPEQWREKQEIEHSGSISAPTLVVNLHTDGN